MHSRHTFTLERTSTSLPVAIASASAAAVANRNTPQENSEKYFKRKQSLQTNAASAEERATRTDAALMRFIMCFVVVSTTESHAHTVVTFWGDDTPGIKQVGGRGRKSDVEQ